MNQNVISSRTPEGEPNKCPVCGNEVCVEPSLWFGDAPCPNCGHLLWFFRTRRETYFIEPSPNTSKLLVAMAPAVFWVPILGMIVTSTAIDRAYWLILPDWISSCLAACFFVAATISLLVLVLMSVIVIAPV